MGWKLGGGQVESLQSKGLEGLSKIDAGYKRWLPSVALDAG